MDQIDRTADLIARNHAMLAQAAAARERSREVIATAEITVRNAMQAIITAQTRLQMIAPPVDRRSPS